MREKGSPVPRVQLRTGESQQGTDNKMRVVSTKAERAWKVSKRDVGRVVGGQSGWKPAERWTCFLQRKHRVPSAQHSCANL